MVKRVTIGMPSAAEHELRRDLAGTSAALRSCKRDKTLLLSALRGIVRYVDSGDMNEDKKRRVVHDAYEAIRQTGA